MARKGNKKVTKQPNHHPLLFGVMVGVIIGGLYFISVKQKTPPVAPVLTKIQLDTAQFSEWKKYTNKEAGIEFSYPPNYTVAPESDGEYISVMSPLNENRGKGYQLQAGELKFEIYISENTEGYNVHTFSQNAAETTDVIDQRSLVVGGQPAVEIRWRGMGDGETVYVIANNKKYSLSKYPMETSRNEEYEKILQSVTFSY
jgi:hypothetical protein